MSEDKNQKKINDVLDEPLETDSDKDKKSGEDKKEKSGDSKSRWLDRLMGKGHRGTA